MVKCSGIILIISNKIAHLHDCTYIFGFILIILGWQIWILTIVEIIYFNANSVSFKPVCETDTHLLVRYNIGMIVVSYILGLLNRGVNVDIITKQDCGSLLTHTNGQLLIRYISLTKLTIDVYF